MNDLQEYEIRYRLLKMLAAPQLTQRQLSAKMGISLGKVDFCMTQLVKKGLVKIDRFKKAKSKAGYIYNLTPHGIEEKARLTLNFLRQKQQEYEEIKRVIEELTQEAEGIRYSGGLENK